MVARRASAVWEGDLKNGKGTMTLGSGVFQGNYSFASRFESGTGTNPEELIGAANAGCFSMALSGALAKAGYQPKRISTTAKVTLREVEGGSAITTVQLDTVAVVPDIDEETFMEHAQGAKSGCPVSKALAGVEISLNAELESA
ncbi:MAG: OsmC family protein [Anaerolineae bacterium]